MKNSYYNILFFLVIGIIIVSCANRGSPSGGEKDILPPEIVRSIPDNFSTNFNAEEIRVYFNEYIKTKNLSKQLVISPPMKNQPDITPLGSASKYITIKILDTLKPNTTYAFNFGNSIVDNNEENPFEFYRYVFSTGDYIDSLSVKGSIKDALDFKAEDFVSVALYKMDSTYIDSLIYKSPPDYITNTLDSTTNFKIENIKAGKYMLRALKDENNNNTFQQKNEKIAFYQTPINLPEDSIGFNLTLFKETPNYRAIKPSLIAGEKLAFGFEGDYKNMEIELLSRVTDSFKSRIYKQKEKDTLLYYYSPKLEVDSLVFKISNAKQQVIDTFSVKIRNNTRDSLVLSSNPKGSIKFSQDLVISGNIPFKSFNKNKITIRDKDSLLVDFKTDYDTLKNDLKIKFEKKESNRYNIELLPNAITDFYNNTNDTLKLSVRTQTKYDYSTARIILENAKFPLIVELTNDKGEVYVSQYIEKNKPIDFEDIDSGKYFLRAIFDTNNNGKYDTGNYLKGIQPERVSYAKKQVEAKAGFDQIITFTLLD